MAICPSCQADIQWLKACEVADRYRVFVVHNELVFEEIIREIDPHEPWFFSEFYCPKCGTKVTNQKRTGS